MARPTLDDWTDITDGVSDAAILRVLQVNPQTLRRWRAGKSRMPHASRELLRITFRGLLPPRGTLWHGWSIGHDGLLYAPGLSRGFSPSDLYTLHWLMQSKEWRSARAATISQPPTIPARGSAAMPDRIPPNPVRWDFTHADGHWSWRRVSVDRGRTPCIDSFENFGAAMIDAMGNGFSPNKTPWLVEDHSSVTYFEPDEPPRILRKGEIP